MLSSGYLIRCRFIRIIDILAKRQTVRVREIGQQVVIVEFLLRLCSGGACLGPSAARWHYYCAMATQVDRVYEFYDVARGLRADSWYSTGRTLFTTADMMIP